MILLSHGSEAADNLSRKCGGEDTVVDCSSRRDPSLLGRTITRLVGWFVLMPDWDFLNLELEHKELLDVWRWRASIRAATTELESASA